MRIGPMKKLICCLAVLSVVPGLCIAQTPIGLAITETHRLSTAGRLVLPLKCDGNGNIYGRFPSGADLQVLEFAPDGFQKSSYSYLSDPELKTAFLQDFAVTENGELYELLKLRKNRSFVVTFSGDGRLASRAELLTRYAVTLSHIVALRGDRFFVSGSHIGDETGKDVGKPFNAIFDGSGRLVREISLKRDVRPKEASGADPNGNTNPAVKWGRAVGGDDGNVYVMRQDSPAQVYVVSQAGAVLRTLKVTAPVPRSLPIELEVSGGRVAIEFSIPDVPGVDDTIIRVVNAQTGQKIADYSITPEIGEAVACFRDDGGFTFLRKTDDWPRIIQTLGR